MRHTFYFKLWMGRIVTSDPFNSQEWFLPFWNPLSRRNQDMKSNWWFILLNVTILAKTYQPTWFGRPIMCGTHFMQIQNSGIFFSAVLKLGYHIRTRFVLRNCWEFFLTRPGFRGTVDNFDFGKNEKACHVRRDQNSFFSPSESRAQCTFLFLKTIN